MKTSTLVTSLLLAAVAVAAKEDVRRRAAVIAAVSGNVSVERGSQRSPVRLREWLPAGESLIVDDGARVVVVFRSGRRFELRGPARATVMSDAMRPGPGVSELERLPPWPPDIKPDEVRGGRAAGTRVRSGTIEGLAPADGAVVLASDVRLRFRPESESTAYAVEVRDEHGKVVFEANVAAAEVPLPNGSVRPGHEYVWAVEAVRTGAIGEAAFRTLDARSADARQRILERRDDPEARAYLDALDEALGLSRMAGAARQ